MSFPAPAEVDWTEVATAALGASAAYLRTPDLAKPAYAAIGHDLVGIFANDDQDAFCSVTRKGAVTAFWFRGTEVTGTAPLDSRMRQIYDNERMAPVAGQRGGQAMAGYYSPLAKLWPQLAPFAKGPCFVGGHSKGAIEGLQSADLFDPDVAVDWIMFAPPHGATPAFWQAAFTGRRAPLLIGRAGDFALNHPIAGSIIFGYRHAAPILELGDGAPHFRVDWPVTDESVPDHSIDDYVADCRAQAQKLHTSS